jgi:hypothetical protein
MEPRLRLQRDATCSLEAFDEEYLLYLPRTEQVVELNETAALVWQLCDGARTVSEITTLVADAFPEERARVTADVETALQALLASGTVRVVEAAELAG